MSYDVEVEQDLIMEELEAAADLRAEVEQNLKDEYAADFIEVLKGDIPDAAVVYYSDNFKPSTIKKDPVDLYLDKVDVYFTPNTMPAGGRTKNKREGKVSDPIALNCFFCDFDAGKDVSGNYLPMAQVDEFKAGVMDRLKQFPKYTAIDETKNGYHVYWFIKEEDKQMNLQQWIDTEKMIVGVLGADPVVKDPARLLRMPFSHASKGGKYRFDTRLICFDPVCRWSAAALDTTVKLFYGGNEWLATQKAVRSNPAQSEHISVTSKEDNPAIKAIKGLDSEYFAGVWANKAAAIEGKFTDWIKSNIDIREFLHLPQGSFRCIVHNDSNPSAVVFEPNETYKYYRYSCSSSNCLAGTALTIVDLVATLAGVDAAAAISFFRKCFGLPAAENYVSQLMDDLILQNQQIIENFATQNSLYDDKLKPLMQVYASLVKCAQAAAESAGIETISYIDFSVSSRFVAKQIGEKQQNVQKKISLCVALGLIGKVGSDQLAKTLTSRDVKFNADCAAAYGGRTIAYYRYMAIDPEQLQTNLETWINAGGTVRQATQAKLRSIFL